MNGFGQMLHAQKIVRQAGNLGQKVNSPVPPIPLGYCWILVASALTALMAMCIEIATHLAPQLSGASIGFIRVVANAAFVGVLSPRTAKQVIGQILRGQNDVWLWIWGVLGAATVATLFASIERLGVGPASVLTATSGAFTAGFAPLVLGVRWRLKVLVAICISLVGVVLMHPPLSSAFDTLGWVLGIVSGLTAGMAYLAVAKLNGRFSTSTIMVYWTIACVCFYLVWFAARPPLFPSSLATWMLVAVSGVLASTAQFFTAKAYTAAPASGVAALSYSAPALVLLLDATVYGSSLSVRQWLGAVMTIGMGVGIAHLVNTDRITVQS